MSWFLIGGCARIVYATTLLPKSWHQRDHLWILEGSVPLFHALGLAICIGCACVSFWRDVAGWMWVTAKNHPWSGPQEVEHWKFAQSLMFSHGWSHPLGSYLWPHIRAICCQVFFEDDGHSSKYQRGVAAFGAVVIRFGRGLFGGEDWEANVPAL